ncbi:MAG: hypothetical protein QME60_06230 [Verrucomicrobiota bacterium]|nr:hypothetical protein [Verrucomicrobiota bacterium]
MKRQGAFFGGAPGPAIVLLLVLFLATPARKAIAAARPAADGPEAPATDFPDNAWVDLAPKGNYSGARPQRART